MDIPPLVDQDWLRAHRRDVHVVDCRFDLTDHAWGRQAYLAGHVPRAVHLDLEQDLSAVRGPGRHPLPDARSFTAVARRAGIRQKGPVVAYDQAMAGGAARLWWLLRHFGKEDAAVLAGGLASWTGPLEAGDAVVASGDFTARPRTGDTVDAEDVWSRLEDPGRLLLDARAPARFRGEVEPLDPIAGHIPGAVNLPYGEALPPPRSLVADERELVAYCGSGVTACVVVLGMAAAGRGDVRLYPGSWSDWSGRGLPVATGDEPG